MRHLKFLLIVILTLSPYRSLEACTLWAAAGKSVEKRGVLVVKNRDWTPDHSQVLKLVDREPGYKFIGLFAEGGNNPGLKAGVNEFGLVVTSATCGDIPKRERKKLPRKRGLNKALLQNCRSVREALAHEDWFRGPNFLLIADRGEIALIEIGRNGKTSIQRTSEGVLYHTNHYVSHNLQEPSPPEAQSSHSRFEQIGRFLSSSQAPFSVEDFFTFSRNKENGPDDSIWRTGSTGKKTRTLATFLVSLPFEGDPSLRVKIADPGKPETDVEMSLTAAFSGKFPALMPENKHSPHSSVEEKEEMMENQKNDKESPPKFLIRRQTGPHCKRGPSRCEKCRNQKPAFHLLDLDPPDKGLVQRPIAEVTVGDKKNYFEYDMIRTFVNEKEARDYAEKNGIPIDTE